MAQEGTDDDVTAALRAAYEAGKASERHFDGRGRRPGQWQTGPVAEPLPAHSGWHH